MRTRFFVFFFFHGERASYVFPVRLLEIGSVGFPAEHPHLASGVWRLKSKVFIESLALFF